MSLTKTGPGPVWASGGEMVTVSSGSEVRGISKAMGGRLRRRLTLTVVEAMFARDWAGGNRRSCRVPPHASPLTSQPVSSLLCLPWAWDVSLGPITPPSLDPRLTDSTWISVIFQKAFQKCTSRF